LSNQVNELIESFHIKKIAINYIEYYHFGIRLLAQASLKQRIDKAMCMKIIDV